MVCAQLSKLIMNRNTQSLIKSQNVIKLSCLLKLVELHFCLMSWTSRALCVSTRLCCHNSRLQFTEILKKPFNLNKAIIAMLECLICLNCTSVVLMVDFHYIFWIIKLYAHSQIHRCFKMMLFHFLFYTFNIFSRLFKWTESWKEHVYQAYLNVAASLPQNRSYQ